MRVRTEREREREIEREKERERERERERLVEALSFYIKGYLFNTRYLHHLIWPADQPF